MSNELLSQQEFELLLKLAALKPNSMPPESASQLEGILKHFSDIQKLSGGQPNTTPTTVAVLREDVVGESMSRKELLNLVPEATEDGYIKIKPALLKPTKK